MLGVSRHILTHSPHENYNTKTEAYYTSDDEHTMEYTDVVL